MHARPGRMLLVYMQAVQVQQRRLSGLAGIHAVHHVDHLRCLAQTWALMTAWLTPRSTVMPALHAGQSCTARAPSPLIRMCILA